MAQAGLDQVRPMVMLDPPEHTGFRRLVGAGFTPRQVDDIEPEVRAFVVERIERLRERGSGDVVAEVFKPLPSMVVAHYLGVPKADRVRFDAWTEAIVAATAEGNPLGAPHAVGELFEYFSGLIEQRRSHPEKDTISLLVGTGADDVSVLQTLGFAFTMVTGGNDHRSARRCRRAAHVVARSAEAAHRRSRPDPHRGGGTAAPDDAGPGAGSHDHD